MNNSNLNYEAKNAVLELKRQLGKLQEAKGILPEKIAKKFAKLVETLTNIESETDSMIDDLENRTRLAFERNFYNYSIIVYMVLSDGSKPTLKTSVRTDDPLFNLDRWVKTDVESLINDFPDNYKNKGISLVSFTYEIEKK